MSKIDQSLSNVFGVEPLYPPPPLVPEKNEIVPVIEHPIQNAASVIPDQDDDLEHDLAAIRNNIHTLIRSGQDAFESVIHIAKAEERISAFEVANSYLSNLAAINMQLITLHEKKKKMKESSKPDKNQGAIVNNGGTTNIAFVGTTKQMMEHMSKNGMIQPIIEDTSDDDDPK